jgi:hypothetical protein
VLIELLRDRRAALAPFGSATAQRMLDRLALAAQPARRAPRLAARRCRAARPRDQPFLACSRRSFRISCARSTSTRSSAVRDIAAVDALFVAA